MPASDIFKDDEARGADIERQPLLASVNPNAGVTAAGHDSSVSFTVSNTDNGECSDKESESESEDEEAEKQFKKQLKESGGWCSYIKRFSIFLPHLWPRNNPKVQFYLLLIGACMAIKRAIKVLIPRQEGIVIDKLIQTYGTGELPWKDLAWLFGLQLINSGGTLDALQNFFELCIHNWSNTQMTNLIFGHIMDLSSK